MPLGIALFHYEREMGSDPTPSTRAGSITIARSSENAPSTAIPSSRNGNESNHTIGHNTIARIASGQQTTSSRSHKRNLIIV